MGNCMCSKFINALIEQPVLGSLFITDFFLVFFLKTAHWTFSALMIGALVAMSMYYGQKLQLFKTSCCNAESAEKAD
jgi:hypothetical protein